MSDGMILGVVAVTLAAMVCLTALVAICYGRTFLGKASPDGVEVSARPGARGSDEP